jgi:hypothetical protein
MRYVCSIILGISLSSTQLSASTFFKLSEQKILSKAGHVITGTVESIDTELEGKSIPYQYIEISITKVLKTNATEALEEGETITLRQLGGKANGTSMAVDGMPKFVEGTEVLISIKKNLNDYYYVVGAEQGKYDVHGKELVRDTSESMFIRRGIEGTIQFYPGKVETSTLSEIITKIPAKRK